MAWGYPRRVHPRRAAEVAKGIAVAHLEGIPRFSADPVLTELQTELELNLDATVPVEVDNYPKTSSLHRHELLQQLPEFRYCFATFAVVGRPTATKHRVITGDYAQSVNHLI